MRGLKKNLAQCREKIGEQTSELRKMHLAQQYELRVREIEAQRERMRMEMEEREERNKENLNWRKNGWHLN